MQRGEIRWYTFRAPDKRRPVLFLTRNSVLTSLGEIIVAPVTRTIRAIPTEVVLTPDDGMPVSCALNLDHVSLTAGFFGGDVVVDDGADGGGHPIATAGSTTCVIKFTEAGDYSWSRCFGGSSLQSLDPQMTLDRDGNIVLAGTFMNEVDFGAFGPDASPSATRLSSAGQGDIYLAKLSAGGEFVWQRQLGNEQSQGASLGLTTTAERSILLAGTSWGTLELGSGISQTSSHFSPFVAGFAADSQTLWSLQLGTSAYTSGADSLVVGDCRTFYLAADYSGDLADPDRPSAGDRVGLVVIAATY